MVEAGLGAMLELACGVTGHLVLWAVTLGRWNVSNGRDFTAIFVGLLFWVAVAGGIWLMFFR